MKHLAFILGCLLMTSCATIFTGTSDRITFNSTPEGATVYIDGLKVCQTPCSYKVNRSITDKDVEIKLDGYQTRVLTLDRTLNVVSVLNLGNLLGWAIDIATGSLMKYDRKGYDIELQRKSDISLNHAKKIAIATKTKTVVIFLWHKNKLPYAGVV